MTALGQAAGTTLAAFSGAFLLQRVAKFDRSLFRVRDAFALVLLGALASALVSASIGVSVLYGTHVHAYSGLGSAWLIYWLGDATGVLLVTPVALTLGRLLQIRDRARITEIAVLVFLLTAACFLIFGDPSPIAAELHVLAFAVLPFVMLGAIRFGVSGAALSILLIATIATVETPWARPFRHQHSIHKRCSARCVLCRAFSNGYHAGLGNCRNGASAARAGSSAGERDLLISYFPIEGAKGIDRVACILQDITERKRAEESLAGMTRKLIEAQEQERTRIGRELHDDINQRLAMLAVDLEQLQEPSEVPLRVQELRKEIADISSDVQALSHDLHSSKLEYLGVVAGIKSWCKEFAERQKIEINCRTEISRFVPPEVGLSLFRVLQEAVHNVIKHSGVRRVEVQLWEDSSEIHLAISDLGTGFDLEAALAGKGLGLTSVRERIRLMHGSISIESKRNGGTTIHVRVPLGSHRDSWQEAV